MKVSALSVLNASASVWPTTSGTETVFSPFDTFNVTVFPSVLDTGGHLFIDGGSPRSKKNGDCLNVSYASKPKVPKKPKVHHKKSPPKRAGTTTVEYPGAAYDIQYTDVEKVKLAKL